MTETELEQAKARIIKMLSARHRIAQTKSGHVKHEAMAESHAIRTVLDALEQSQAEHPTGVCLESHFKAERDRARRDLDRKDHEVAELKAEVERKELARSLAQKDADMGWAEVERLQPYEREANEIRTRHGWERDGRGLTECVSKRLENAEIEVERLREQFAAHLVQCPQAQHAALAAATKGPGAEKAEAKLAEAARRVIASADKERTGRRMSVEPLTLLALEAALAAAAKERTDVRAKEH